MEAEVGGGKGEAHPLYVGWVGGGGRQGVPVSNSTSLYAGGLSFANPVDIFKLLNAQYMHKTILSNLCKYVF